MQTILLTGCAGFIGSNFIPYFLNKHENYNLIHLDLLTYAGDLENLKESEDNSRYKFIKGNICNRDLIEHIFTEYNIKGVIHFAAESHVDNSITNPGVFIETNVNGTFTLIDVAQKHWMNKPFQYKEEHKNCRFHHISTDEVYGTLGETGLFTEQTPYAPNSPYSASKASSDMIIRAYNETFGLNTIITNCSNNYGPKQHGEKLIPTIIRNAIQQNPIPIYGDGKNIRDWLFVLDHCKGIDLAYHKGKTGETYNIGGRNEKDNLYIVNKICEILDKLNPIKNTDKNNYITALGVTYGVFARKQKTLTISNPIYSQIIQSWMLSLEETGLGLGLPLGYTSKEDCIDEKGLDINLTLKKFQEFMQEFYSNKDDQFIEKHARFILLAFLKPIINGNGFLFIEPETNNNRKMDLVITYNKQRFIIELKIWRGTKKYDQGINQLCQYLDTYNLNNGHLLIFNFNKNKEYKTEQITKHKKNITAVFV